MRRAAGKGTMRGLEGKSRSRMEFKGQHTARSGPTRRKGKGEIRAVFQEKRGRKKTPGAAMVNFRPRPWLRGPAERDVEPKSGSHKIVNKKTTEVEGAQRPSRSRGDTHTGAHSSHGEKNDRRNQGQNSTRPEKENQRRKGGEKKVRPHLLIFSEPNCLGKKTSN